jgi:hypothetical protein
VTIEYGPSRPLTALFSVIRNGKAQHEMHVPAAVREVYHVLQQTLNRWAQVGTALRLFERDLPARSRIMAQLGGTQPGSSAAAPAG